MNNISGYEVCFCVIEFIFSYIKGLFTYKYNLKVTLIQNSENLYEINILYVIYVIILY